MAAAVFDKHAEAYQEKYMDVSLYHDSFDVFCQYVPAENARVLELACGPGNITRYLRQKRPDFQILGIDLSPKMVELARTNNPDATFMCLDCRDIRQLDQTFDALMVGFCLPYLSVGETEQLVCDAAAMLPPKGVLYLSTMEDDYSASEIQRASTGDAVYMYFYRADDLTRILEAQGFSVVYLDRKTYPGRDGATVTDLLLVAVLA